MPNITDECGVLTTWIISGWPFLLFSTLFSFMSGYVICALARSAGEDWWRDDP
jgi:hypothetical protein